jgi:hypothetical protein
MLCLDALMQGCLVDHAVDFFVLRTVFYKSQEVIQNEVMSCVFTLLFVCWLLRVISNAIRTLKFSSLMSHFCRVSTSEICVNLFAMAFAVDSVGYGQHTSIENDHSLTGDHISCGNSSECPQHIDASV